MRSRLKAFTLMEMVVVAGLVALMAGMTGISFVKLRPHSSAQGLATIVVEEMRRVRQEAVTHRRPVAFVVRKDGANNFSRSYYVVEGETRPRITRSTNYSTEYNGAGMFVGTWTPTSSTPGTGLPVPAGSKWSTFDDTQAANWIASSAGLDNSGNPDDFYFIFLPDGSVRTNQLPSFADSYHLVVANGVSASGGTLTAAGEAFTVVISSIGGISLEGGISESNLPHTGNINNGSVNLSPPMVDRPLGKILPAPDPVSGGNYPSILPKPAPPTGGVDAYVRVGQFLTFQMGCTSEAGDELYGQYMITVGSNNGLPAGSNKKPGAFSMRGSTGTLVEVDPNTIQPSVGSGSFMADGGRMEWSQSEQCWRSTWQWTPPPEAIPGDVYTLTPLVRNTPTGTPKQVGIAQNVTVEFPGTVLYQTNKSGSLEVWSTHETSRTPKLFKTGAKQPTATRNGARIAWIDTAGDIQIAFRESPGDAFKLNDSSKGNCDLPALSPLGNYIAFRRNNHVFVMNTIPENDPNNAVVDVGPHQIDDGTQVKAGTQKMSWSSDGQNLYYVNDSHQVICQNFLSHKIKPTLGPATTRIAAGDPAGGSPWCAVSCGIDDTIFLMSNWNNPNFDPWFWRYAPSAAPWHHKTIGDDEATPERNPRGGMTILESWRSASTDPYVIRRSDNGGADNQNAVFLGNVTTPSDGSCLYPVWTQ